MADLTLMREDVGAFAGEVGWPLARWQVEPLALEARVTAIVAPRQSGKSRSLAVLAVWWAFRQREQRVLIVSAGEDASRRLLAEVRAIVNGSRLLAGSVLDEQAGLVTLSNGSEVRSVPASERQVRGWTVDLLLVDEAALVPDDLLLGAALPTTAARPEARVVLASSALTSSGAFYDHAIRGEQGSEHVRTFRWALVDATWISPSVIEAARESMTEMRFRAEYEGVFASGADALFTRAAIDRATADYLPTALGSLAGPARLLAGVDWGATIDRSALVAIGRLPVVGERVFGVACSHRWRAGEPLEDVIGAIAGSGAFYDTLAMETNGLGMPCAQSLARRILERSAESGGGRRAPRHTLIDAEDLDAFLTRRQVADPARVGAGRGFRTRPLLVHTTAELKAAAYSSLRLLIDQGRLLLPASAEDLLRELLLLRVDLTPTGERIEASSGHDDLADALMLASCPFRARDGRWSTLLAHYAEPQRALPDAAVELAGRGLAMVTSGGGVAVPRLPVWQSVRGSQLTVPGGVDLDAPAPLPLHLQDLRDRIAAAATPHPKEKPHRG